MTLDVYMKYPNCLIKTTIAEHYIIHVLLLLVVFLNENIVQLNEAN